MRGKKIPEFSVHAFAEVSDLGMHVVAEVTDLGMYVFAEALGLGIHMNAEVRDGAAQFLDVLARDAVQVEHDTDDDGRGDPLGEFR